MLCLLGIPCFPLVCQVLLLLRELVYLILLCFYLVKRHSFTLFLLIDDSVINGQTHSEVCSPVPGFQNIEMPKVYHIFALNATGILRTHFKEKKKEGMIDNWTD